VLTFFDYLRQRAFQSVLAGAQEALELLESQKNLGSPKADVPKLPAPVPDGQTEPTAKQEGNKLLNNPPVVDDQLLPSPRRRGRPHKKSKGNG